KQLFETAEIAKFTPTERLDYEESLKIYRDLYSTFKTKYNKGFAKGLKQGEKIGIEKGREEERTKAHQEKLDMAIKMKTDGMPNEIIIKYLGLTLNEIEKL
ncbi:MAG: hypothetical protein MJ211_08660, partial [Bacteroidales bacterium]|nr:hypothetical protein [Bacteroidales bacterium]